MRATATRTIAACAFAAAALGLSGDALGRAAVDDLAVTVVLQGSNRTKTVTTPQVAISYLVETDGPVQTVTLRTSIPDGLRVVTAPAVSDGCKGTISIVCTSKLLESDIVFYQYDFGLVADRSGSYSITATIEGERPDPNTANNSNTLQFQVKLPAAGGGVGSASVSSARATPAKPKAGGAVTFTSAVKVGGKAARPSKVACAAKLGGKAKAGTARAATGSASCRYTTKKADKGKTLAGSMRVTVKGTTFTKRFSAKLG